MCQIGREPPLASGKRCQIGRKGAPGFAYGLPPGAPPDISACRVGRCIPGVSQVGPTRSGLRPYSGCGRERKAAGNRWGGPVDGGKAMPRDVALDQGKRDGNGPAYGTAALDLRG